MPALAASSVAVVIATLERPVALRRLVLQLLHLAPMDAEILVVDQSMGDVQAANAEWCRARKDGRLTYRSRTFRSLPAARNVGVAATRAPIILFLDDDVVPRSGCIAAHLARYRDPTVGGVVGRIDERRLRPNTYWTTNRIGMGGRVVTRLDGPDASPIETLKGANMSLRRQAIMQAGGFDVGFGGTSLLEDADLSVRVRRCGWRLLYEPDAAVEHHHLEAGGVRTDLPQGGAEWWRFHNTARFVRKHRGWVGLAPMMLTFGAIAARRAIFSVDPRGAASCLRALGHGWWSGNTEEPDLGSTG